MSKPASLRVHLLVCWRWYVVLALAVAPLLARMHQVLHVPGHLPAHASTLVQHVAPNGSLDLAVLAAETGAHQETGSALHALFAHHVGLDCQALDQLAQGQATLFDVPWQPADGASNTPLACPAQAVHCLRRSAPVARGPPGIVSVLWF